MQLTQAKRLCSLIMMIDLVFIIFFNIKHLILWWRYKISSSWYVTASYIWIGIPTSWIKFGWWIKTKVLIAFKLIYIFYMYSTSINARWPWLLLPNSVFLILNLRISPQYRSWFLIFATSLNLVILLLCLLFWSYLIHRFCAYSYSWFWLNFHWDLLSIIGNDNASISTCILRSVHFRMLLRRSIGGQ